MNKYSILIIGNFLSASVGVRGVCEELAGRFTEHGWRVITSSTRLNRFSRLWDMIATTWKNRQHFRIAIVDVYSGPAFIWAEIIARLLHWMKKPFILTLHGGNLPDHARRWPMRTQRLLTMASAVTTPSAYLKERLSPIRADIHLIPNAIEVDHYRFQLRAAPRPKLIWLRAFHAIYNPLLAVQTVAKLRAEFPDISLLMVGPDKHDGSLDAVTKAIHELGLREVVEIIAGVPKTDVPVWLNKGDIFLNTSMIDNTPVTVIEALACGLCVVSTNVGGMPFLLADQRDALLVPGNDCMAMVKAVGRLLTDKDLASTLSGNARKKAESFDWDKVMELWHQLLINIPE